MDPIALAILGVDECDIHPMLDAEDQNIFIGVRYHAEPNPFYQLLR